MDIPDEMQTAAIVKEPKSYSKEEIEWKTRCRFLATNSSGT